MLEKNCLTFLTDMGPVIGRLEADVSMRQGRTFIFSIACFLRLLITQFDALVFFSKVIFIQAFLTKNNVKMHKNACPVAFAILESIHSKLFYTTEDGAFLMINFKIIENLLSASFWRRLHFMFTNEYFALLSHMVFHMNNINNS